MPPRLDHLILLVHDIDEAVAAFSGAGFTVLERADAKAGSTLSRFVVFADDSYIQLAAFRSPQTIETHRLGPVMASGGGFADYSILVADLDEAGRRGAAAGVILGAVHEVGNSVAGAGDWSLRLLLAGRGTQGDEALPFLVQDVAGRGVRVPPAPSHGNGARGIAAVTVASTLPAASARRLRALLGLPTDASPQPEHVVSVGGCTVTFVEAGGGRLGPVAVAVRCPSDTAPARLSFGNGGTLTLGAFA